MPRTLLTAASSAGTAALLLLAVSACGGGEPSAATTPTSGTQPQNQSAAPGVGQPPPGASGKIAAISGRTLQVQNAQSGQVAVTYTTKTTFTKVVTATDTAVKVGSCVLVRSAAEQTSGTAATGRVTAASVQLSAPANGECGGDVLRGVIGGDGGTRPSGAPTGAPGPGDVTGGNGEPGARGGLDGARPVSGLVTAVDGSTITVAAVTFGAPGTGGRATASPTETPSTSPVEVTTTSSTTYSKTVAGAAKDLAVGQCVTAIGKPDDTGAVTASAIASQPAVNGACNVGILRRADSSSGGTL